MERDARIDPALIKAYFDMGLMGIQMPERHGGAGGSVMMVTLAVEEISKVDAAAAIMVDVQNTLVNNVFAMYASPSIQDYVFPALATDAVGSFCLSEAGSGSDAFALRTRADKKGGDYVINGTKMWITNAAEARFFLVMANVDLSKGYKGITCFLVERDAPGLSIGKKEDKMGIRASSTAPCPPASCQPPLPASETDFAPSSKQPAGARLMLITSSMFRLSWPRR